MNQYTLKKRNGNARYFAESDLLFTAGDVVIFETGEGSLETAIIEMKTAKAGEDALSNHLVKIQRKASIADLKILADHKKKEDEARKICHEEARKAGLPMKIVGANYSFDGGNITFTFVADGRIDFRDLVKNLSRKFQRSIRLHQIGARDESRQKGGFGICGRELCCIGLKGDLPSITSDMAKIQQISHRGSERISGSCGRLMCCLAFEAEQYRCLLEEFPKIGEQVKYQKNTATVKNVNVMTQEIELEQEDNTIIRVKKDELG